MLWDRTELEHIPYYSTRRQRYAGMDRQEKAQMGSDKAFHHVLGTGRGKDDTWHAPRAGEEKCRMDKLRSRPMLMHQNVTPNLQQSKPLSIART